MLALMVFGASGAVRADENKPVTEGNAVTVHVIEKDSEENLPGAVIKIEEAGLAAVTDADGHCVFRNIPAGTYTLSVRLLGYASQEKKISVSRDFAVDVHFVMTPDVTVTDEVVVSANRNETNRRDAPVVVNVLNSKLFEAVNSSDLAKSLNYQSGLRVENNCQNCGFPQVRINGLEALTRRYSSTVGRW